MHRNHNTRSFAFILATVSLIVFQLACNLLSRPASAPPAVNQPEEIEAPKDQEDSLPVEDEGSSGEQSESPIEPQFGQETLPCPPKGTTLALGFDAFLTVNYEATSVNHFLHQGWINLEVVDEDGTIASVGTTSLKYSMEGRMSAECSLTGEGNMLPNAHGMCEAGVVSLIIEENWGPLQGEMVCIDEDGDVTSVPFNAPAIGMQTHSGSDGSGEIFYLVEGSEGYSSMRPFAEGEGYHTWTLYTSDIPVVPLVPQE